MGLLFKMDGVSQSSGTFQALSIIMTLLVIGFVATWIGVVFTHFHGNIKRNLMHRTAVKDGATARLSQAPSQPQAGSRPDASLSQGPSPRDGPGTGSGIGDITVAGGISHSELALSEKFNSVYGKNGQSTEDFDWLLRLYPKTKTEMHIDAILHYYIYNSNTTASLVPRELQ